MTPTQKRRFFPIVHKGRQYRFLAYTLIYAFLLTGALMAAVFLPDILTMQDMDLTLQERVNAADRVLILHMRVWPMILVLICFIGIHSFRTFHRFVGPLHRFSHTFQEVGKGDVRIRIFLRKGDYLIEEAVVFNEMMDNLSGKIKAIKMAGDEARTLLDSLERYGKPGADAAFDKAIAPLRNQLASIADTMAFFRLQQDAEDATTEGTPSL